MASLVNTTVTSSSGSSVALEVNQASGSAVSLAVKGCNDIVDNILLNLLNQSGSSVLNVRNNGALYGLAGTFKPATGTVGLTVGNTTGDTRLDITSSENSDVTFNVCDAAAGGTSRALIIKTGNSERMRIAADGNVGIGTNAPESLLHLQGSIPIIILHDTNTAVSGDDYGKIQWHTKDASMPGTDDIGAEIKATDDSTYGDRAALLFSTAHNATSLTERMRIASNGNVGIGTNAPAALLHVGGASASPHAAADDFVIAPAATDVGMTIRCNSNSGTGSIFFADTAGNAQGTVRYNHNSDYMSFYSTGDFYFDGISGADVLFRINTGSTEKDARLMIGEADNYGMTFEYDGVANMGYLGMNNNVAPTGAWSKRIQMSRSGTEVAFMAGRVGIGTATPAFPFEIRASNLTNGDAKRVASFFDTTSSTTGTGGGIALGGWSNGGASPVNDFAVIQGIKENATAGNYASAMLFSTRANGASPAEQMRINSDGNVGIGESSPDSRLHIKSLTDSNSVSGITIERSSTTQKGYINMGGGALNLNVDSGLPIKFRDGGTANVTISGSGVLGVGTESPFGSIHANGTNGGIYQVTRTSGNTTGTLGIVRFGNTDIDSNLINIKGIQDGATDSARLEFQTQPTGGATVTRMTIKSDGKVGIGTDDPTNNLVVYATGHQVNFVTETDDHSGMRVKGAAAKDKYILFNDQCKIGYQHSTATLHLCRSAAFGDNHLVINSNGSVGIGTATPGVRLHSHATSGHNSLYVTTDGTSSSTTALWFAHNYSATADWAGIVWGVDNLLRITNSGTSTSTQFVINESGCIGIGTDTPGGLLEVHAASGAVLSHVKSGSVISRLTANSTTSDGTVGTSSAHDFLIQRGGSTRMTFSGSSVVVNDSGENIDFRVEGDGDANLIRTDAANDRVGIGTATPGKRLEVIAAADGDGIEIGSSSGHIRRIDFTRTQTNANPTARIQVMEPGSTHTSDMRFYTSDASGSVPNLVERMAIDQNGQISTPDNDLTALLGKARIGKMGYSGYAAFGHRALGDVAGKYAVLQDSNGGSYFNAASGQTASFRIANSDQMVLSSGQLKFPDSKKIIMGTGNDLEIYHDGANSYITDAGTGNLNINASNLALNNGAVTKTYLLATDGGSVQLRHNDVIKFETASGGVTITGTATATAFSGSGASLTSLNASNLSSGTVATARLGSGTASSSTYLRGDGTWATVSGGGGSGTVTEVTVGTGLDVSNGTSTPNITLDFNELATAGTVSSTDDFVVVDGTATRKEQMSSINLNGFNGYYGLLNTIYKNNAENSVTPDSNGAIYFYEGTGMQLSFSGNTITFSGTSSDYRLKKNISTFNSEAWTKVKSVNLRKFDFDEDAYKTAIASPDREITTDPKHYVDNLGFIAHELAEAEIKEAVVGDKDGVDEDGNFIYQKVNYLALVPVLWGALNEAISKIETLESKVQALEDK